MSSRRGVPHHRRHGRTRFADGRLARRPRCTSSCTGWPHSLPPRRDWNIDTNDADTRHRIAAIQALEMRGVSVDAVAVDVGSRDAVQALLARRDDEGAPPIRGVIHAAGVTDSQLLTEIADGPLRRTMWPKIAGAQTLHEAFPPASLDFLFLTASAGTVFGIPGQGAYAAANAYLDGLASASPTRLPHRQSGLGSLAGTRVRHRRPNRRARA